LKHRTTNTFVIFNNGYTIAENNPALGKQLSGMELGDQRSGLKDGAGQYLKEITKANSPSWLSGKGTKDHIEKTHDKDTNKDHDFEP
jgi:hypothetical protein